MMKTILTLLSKLSCKDKNNFNHFFVKYFKLCQRLQLVADLR